MSTTFLASNYLSLTGATPLTPSHQTAAELGAVVTLNAGSATMGRFGTYTDVVSRDYVIQIDSVTGSAINQATFRWSDTGGATWNNSLIGIIGIAPFGLSHGILVNWLVGPGSPQFVLGDSWRFRAERKYPVTNLTDLRRDYEYRSGAVADAAVVTIPFDLSTQRTPSHLILFDHNLLSGTTIRLQSSEASNFSPLEYNQVVPWASSKIIYPLVSPTAARYWRLHLTAAAGQTEVRIGEWYLGDALEMSRSFSIGFTRQRVHAAGGDVAQLMRGPAPLGLMPTRYEIRFEVRQLGGENDIGKLRTLDALTNDGANRQRKPFWIYQDEGQVFLEMVQFESDPVENHRFLDRYDSDLTLVSCVRTAA